MLWRDQGLLGVIMFWLDLLLSSDESRQVVRVCVVAV